MATKLNCPNCAGVIDNKLHKCPYCGTSYYDLSAIDLDGSKPTYLKLKLPDGKYITSLVVPELNNIEISYDMTDITGRDGAILKKVCTGRNMTFDLTFHAVTEEQKNSLCEIYIGDDDR